ncbi:alkaline phosphatase [Pseudomonas sp. 5Ae-yellow]|uniref:alkaline phosphatase D family protein n=1 Tax=Pseudomonas sp. 5Ae-yellow TaxID=2759848 RepID=UPI0015F36DCF|nr:alkaline phosphatase D family protein [Pseudomonas sp. 5Ae-yellow]MBA6421318.1 alkaline phosphatase D family protein [Pseudomonas sp. 5Ae-yellow]
MAGFTRRDFLRASGLALGGIVVSTGLQGCLSGGSSSSPSAENRSLAFEHGVASGDPLADRIMVWTRVTPKDANAANVEVSWEVASDAAFTQLLHSGSASTGPERDYTLKVDVQNLLPGETYFYRFKAGNTVSATGKMKTLPSAGVQQVRFAVMSCANFPAGYFHAYAEAARESELDAVLHLGDYIYEYGTGGYATEDAAALGRSLSSDNNTELLNLSDYRKRYALYRTDTDLQSLHAAAPFIAVWDDHEVANDTWKDGAENHNEGEGDFTERKLAALQAYFEWLPVRPASEDDELTIYRSFDFGDLVSLHMLDTRIIGRDEQLDYADYTSQSGFDAVGFTADVSSSSRSLLGQTQMNWLQTQLAVSTATWQVLGQQVLMGRMLLPAEMLTALSNPAAADLGTLLGELVQLKIRVQQKDPSLTSEEIARITTVIPYNLDAWDGYAYEREVIFGLARSLDKNLVVLAGDTHNAWANNLKTQGGEAVGVEFATAGITSPGLESYLGLPAEAMPQAEQAITLLVDELKYLNANQRGYLLVTFTPDEATADWRYVSTVKARDYTVDAARGLTLSTLPGSANRTLIEDMVIG